MSGSTSFGASPFVEGGSEGTYGGNYGGTYGGGIYSDVQGLFSGDKTSLLGWISSFMIVMILILLFLVYFEASTLSQQIVAGVVLASIAAHFAVDFYNM